MNIAQKSNETKYTNFVEYNFCTYILYIQLERASGGFTKTSHVLLDLPIS